MKILNSQKAKITIYCTIVLNIICNYIFLYDIYRPHNVDDAWFLAFSYNYFKFGEILDRTFNAGTTEGLLFFRKTGAFFYGYILSKIGWDYGKAQFLSALLMVGSGWLWFLALKKLDFKPNERNSFILLFFYMEFSFAASTSLRYEPLILFFQSAALLLFLQKRYFLTGLVSLIAMETHPIALLNLAYPIGIIATSYPLVHGSGFIHKLKSKQHEIFYFLLGCIVGLAYYFYLHPLSLTNLYQFLYLNSIQGVGEYYDTKLGILGLYFFSTKYFRHIPELIILIIALYLFLHNRIDKNRPFILIWVSLLIILSFLRPIFTYAAIIFPAFIVLMISSFQAIRKLNLLLIIFICLMVPQYFAVYYLNHDWNRNTYFTEIKSIAPKEDLPVVGSAMSWFALKENQNFKSGVYPFSNLKKPAWEEAYLVEDHFYRNKPEYSGARNYFEKNYRSSIIKRSNITSEPIILKKLTQK
jgi:hypothetical protein